MLSLLKQHMALGRITFQQVFIATVTVIYLFFISWMLKLYLGSETESTENFLTGFYTIVTLLGGLYGLFFVARHWGGWHSNIGKAVIFISFSSLAWSLGDMIWMYYNFVLNVELPYPSWADAAYILVNPFWALGGIFLATATGAIYGLRKVSGKVILLVVPVIAIAVSYYFLITVAQGGVIDLGEGFVEFFFALVYPVGDALILAVVILIYALSYKYFGGKYRFAIQVTLASFLLGYLADFTFSYTTSLETYYNGDFTDALFATATYVTTLGLALLDSRSVSLRSGVQNRGQVSKMAGLIVEGQLSIMGPMAWEEAQEVDGLSIDVSRNEVYVEGDSREVLGRLVAQYEKLFGRASVEACREAVRPVISQVPSDQIPDMLK